MTDTEDIIKAIYALKGKITNADTFQYVTYATE